MPETPNLVAVAMLEHRSVPRTGTPGLSPAVLTQQEPPAGDRWLCNIRQDRMGCDKIHLSWMGEEAMGIGKKLNQVSQG